MIITFYDDYYILFKDNFCSRFLNKALFYSFIHFLFCVYAWRDIN